MLEKVELQGVSQRLNREEWLQQALEYLARSGAGELRIDRLTRALGVTKGSFYHHFRSRAHFIEALLDYWNRFHNLSVRKALDETAPESGEERLRVVMQAIYSGRLARYDLPIRAWARDNPTVFRFVQQVDRWRLRLIEDIFREIGFEGEELVVRTRAFVTFCSLEGALSVQPTQSELEQQFETRFRFLTRP